MRSCAAACGEFYANCCPNDPIRITKSNNDVAAAKTCGHADEGPTVDVALMTLQLASSEASLLSNGFPYVISKTVIIDR